MYAAFLGHGGGLSPEVTNFCFSKMPIIGVKARPPEALPDFMGWSGGCPPSILGRVPLFT